MQTKFLCLIAVLATTSVAVASVDPPMSTQTPTPQSYANVTGIPYIILDSDQFALSIDVSDTAPTPTSDQTKEVVRFSVKHEDAKNSAASQWKQVESSEKGYVRIQNMKSGDCFVRNKKTNDLVVRNCNETDAFETLWRLQSENYFAPIFFLKSFGTDVDSQCVSSNKNDGFSEAVFKVCNDGFRSFLYFITV